MEEYNIVFAGVGGQGILLAAEILGTAAVTEGHNVRVSEIHGMAQRGGAVVSHIRMGDEVFSPTILEGTADVLVGFEPMEALRNIRFASQKTRVLLNTNPFQIVGADYPKVDDIFQQIYRFTRNVTLIDAATLSQKAGGTITQNIVMLGALSAIENIPIPSQTLEKIIGKSVPAKYLEVNTKAFKLGHNAIRRPTLCE